MHIPKLNKAQIGRIWRGGKKAVLTNWSYKKSWKPLIRKRRKRSLPKERARRKLFRRDNKIYNFKIKRNLHKNKWNRRSWIENPKLKRVILTIVLSVNVYITVSFTQSQLKGGSLVQCTTNGHKFKYCNTQDSEAVLVCECYE